MDQDDSPPVGDSQAATIPQNEGLPPLRTYHLFFLVTVAGLLAALFRRVSIGIVPIDFSATRSLGNLLHWEAVYLGIATWVLGTLWFVKGRRGFVLQPAPWLVMMHAVESGAFSNMVLCLERVLWKNNGPLQQFCNQYWGVFNWWYSIDSGIVGAALLCLAFLPRHIADVGPLWRLLLILVVAAHVMLGWQPSWFFKPLISHDAQWSGSLALGAAAMIQDVVAGRARHWSQWWCAGLWIAASLGLVLALD